ncbi:MAG: ATP-binding cassette domain-containing protein, partial [Muribaculaceae bacterium]|nr:ATP-binding cassette domain-containing protein [Muribaculaceae bacterium]
MINLTNVTYWYHKSHKALDDTTATIDEGIYLLLGENGAGKTTLLEIISGLLFPRSGHCSVNGMNVSERQPQTLQQVFMLSDTADLPCLTINELKRIHAPFYPTFSADDLALNLSDMGLTGDEPLKSLSFGTRKKAAIAYVLAL